MIWIYFIYEEGNKYKILNQDQLLIGVYSSFKQAQAVKYLLENDQGINLDFVLRRPVIVPKFNGSFTEFNTTQKKDTNNTISIPDEDEINIEDLKTIDFSNPNNLDKINNQIETKYNRVMKKIKNKFGNEIIDEFMDSIEEDTNILDDSEIIEESIIDKIEDKVEPKEFAAEDGEKINKIAEAHLEELSRKIWYIEQKRKIADNLFNKLDQKYTPKKDAINFIEKNSSEISSMESSLKGLQSTLNDLKSRVSSKKYHSAIREIYAKLDNQHFQIENILYPKEKLKLLYKDKSTSNLKATSPAAKESKVKDIVNNLKNMNPYADSPSIKIDDALAEKLITINTKKQKNINNFDNINSTGRIKKIKSQLDKLWGDKIDDNNLSTYITSENIDEFMKSIK